MHIIISKSGKDRLVNCSLMSESSDVVYCLIGSQYISEMIETICVEPVRMHTYVSCDITAYTIISYLNYKQYLITFLFKFRL
jgi:hypothetical protein